MNIAEYRRRLKKNAATEKAGNLVHLHNSKTSTKRFEEMGVGEYWEYLCDKEKHEEEMQARLDAEQAEQARLMKERQVKEIEDAYKEWRGQGSAGGLLYALNQTMLCSVYAGKVKPDFVLEDVPRAIKTLTAGAGVVGRLLGSFDFQGDYCDTKALGYFLEEVSGITVALKDIVYESHCDTSWTLEKLLEEKESVQAPAEGGVQ